MMRRHKISEGERESRANHPTSHDPEPIPVGVGMTFYEYTRPVWVIEMLELAEEAGDL